MKADIYHEIDNDPKAEDAGTLRITARIFGEYDHYLTFTTSSPAKDFIYDEEDECKSKEDLNFFLVDAGISDDDISDALFNLIIYVDDVTCPASTQYSPECALEVRLDLVPEDHDGDEDDDSQIEEAVQVSFDVTSNIQFRPASKLVVKSLSRKIYKKKIKKEKKKKTHKRISLEECTICFEEFKNGGRVVTLPCAHDFDDDCIVKWFETSNFCPLCRYELPCEDQ